MDFQPAKKQISSCSVRRLSIVVLMFFLCFLLLRMETSNFRIGTLRVLLSHILNLTTGDTRQDGQSSPFTASSSQRVRGMRNCRASIVAETEKRFSWSISAYIHCCLLLRFKKKYAGLFRSDRRPIQNRPLVETKVTRLSIARTRHAHIHDVSYYCCAARLYT